MTTYIVSYYGPTGLVLNAIFSASDLFEAIHKLKNEACVILSIVGLDNFDSDNTDILPSQRD